MAAILTYDVGERRDIDVSKEIIIPDPDETALTVILMKAKKDPVDTTEFNWWEDDYRQRWTKVNNAAGYLADATEIVLDAVTHLSLKDIVKIPRTGEVLFITAITTATKTITVTRGYGATAGAVINDNDDVVRLGNAMEENSSAPESNLRQPTKLLNYCQIMRTPFDESMSSADEPKKAGPSERVRLRRMKAIEHRRDIEHVVLFGEAKDDTTNKRKLTGGLTSFITTNIKTSGGTMSQAEWDDFCRMLFTKGSSKKLVVASGVVLQALAGFMLGKLETKIGEETYGLRMGHYVSPHGDVYLVRSKALTDGYSGYAFGLDMDHIYYRPKRNTTLRANIQANDLDGWKDEYLTEFGVKVEAESTHAILKGVTG